ncbi:MAG: class I SAM-dependent methyltransferase [Acidimicrobiales bacterium]
MRDAEGPDPDAVARFALRVWQYKQGELVSLMVHLGDRLGLYRAMDGTGPVTAEAVAHRTGTQARWVLEWLRGQAAAGLLQTDGEAARFELTPEGAAVLAREEDSLAFAAGAFSGGAAAPEVVDALAEAFRTGRGLTYDQQGPAAAHQTERMLAPWARLALVPRIIPALDGVAAKLERGARVADVGCGAGVAVRALARAFPASTFEGTDMSELAIRRARQAAAEENLDNAVFAVARAEELEPGAGFDLILTFDCLHDMTHPDRAAAAIRGALADDGTWLIREIKSSGSWAGDQRNPMLALLYGSSVTSCMSSALSEPDGAGLGTLGLPPDALRTLCRAAGFERVVLHDLDDPANLYYEARPTSAPKEAS